MLPEVGATELLVIAAIALIVVGPKDLPVLMRKVGRWIAHMRGMAAEFRASFDELARQSELEELRREVDALRQAAHGPIETAVEHHLGLGDVKSDIESGLADAPPADAEAAADIAAAAELPPAAPPRTDSETAPEALPDPAPPPRRRRRRPSLELRRQRRVRDRGLARAPDGPSGRAAQPSDRLRVRAPRRLRRVLPRFQADLPAPAAPLHHGRRPHRRAGEGQARSVRPGGGGAGPAPGAGRAGGAEAGVHRAARVLLHQDEARHVRGGGADLPDPGLAALPVRRAGPLSPRAQGLPALPDGRPGPVLHGRVAGLLHHAAVRALVLAEPADRQPARSRSSSCPRCRTT